MYSSILNGYISFIKKNTAQTSEVNTRITAYLFIYSSDFKRLFKRRHLYLKFKHVNQHNKDIIYFPHGLLHTLE